MHAVDALATVLPLFRIMRHECVRPVLDFDTANTKGTSFVHSMLDYCTSMYYVDVLPKTRLDCLQCIQNSLTHAAMQLCVLKSCPDSQITSGSSYRNTLNTKFSPPASSPDCSPVVRDLPFSSQNAPFLQNFSPITFLSRGRILWIID